MQGYGERWMWLVICVVAVLLGGCPRKDVGKVGAGSVSGDWPTFQGNNAHSGYAAGPAILQPRVLWRQEIGIQGWLNNPVIVGGRVYVGSSGLVWNEPDEKDGVYCLELKTGRIVWFSRAENDVNGVSWAGDRLVVTGDEGAAWALSAQEGKRLWRKKGEGDKMYTNPLIVSALAVVGDSEGWLYGLELRSGEIKWQTRLQGAIRGGAASDGELIFVGSEGGEFVILDLAGEEQLRVSVTYSGYEEAPAQIYAAPTLVGDLVILGFARDTYYETPALIAADYKKMEQAWSATDPSQFKEWWGNVRSSPAVFGELLIWGEPYSNLVVAAGVKDGEVKWVSPAGYCTFPHYPSPAILGEEVIIPRHDGWVYALSAKEGQFLWGLYLGDVKEAGKVVTTPEPPAYPDGEHCSWESPGPIYASPAVSQGVIVVGTSQGYLFGIGEGK